MEAAKQADSRADGSNTQRQLTDVSGEVTFAARYTPWGDTLETYGVGGFTFGYFGGVMDAATGLLYVGNGQYYDPETGRFLTRDAKPNSNNPYVPMDPMGMLFAPLALLALFFTRRKKGSKWGAWLALLLVVLSVSMSLAACGPAPTPTPAPTQPPTQPPSETPTPSPTPSSTPTQTPLPPTQTPTLPDGCATGLWHTGYDQDRNNLEIIAKRIYFEGASSFGDKDMRKKIFMAQAWALRTLQAYLYTYQASYTWITENAFSIGSSKDNEDWIEDHNYVEITRCILNSQPCAYGPNPWPSGKAVQWISPQNLNRRNPNNQEISIRTDKINNCNTADGCQLPDMRSRDWMVNLDHVVGYVEAFVPLGTIETTGDGVLDFDECYWKGVYFIDDRNAFETAKNGIYYPPPVESERESLKCPQGRSGEISNLPVMPNLYGSP